MCNNKDKMTPEEVDKLLNDTGLEDRVNKYEIFDIEHDSPDKEKDK